MKKSLFALAAVTAFAGAAQAQSSVTVYGILDVGFAGSSATTPAVSSAATGSQTIKTNQTGFSGVGSETTSRLGFRGTEDLGGGTSAFFTIEMSMAPTESNQFTTMANRQTFVGLAQKGIGRAAIGTQYTPIHLALANTDPGQYNNMRGNVIYATNAGQGSGETTVAYTVRLNNSLTLATDNIAGFRAYAIAGQNNRDTTQTAPAYTSATGGGNNNNQAWGLGVNYNYKKFVAALAYQSVNNQVDSVVANTATTVAAGGLKDNQYYAGASYDFGILKAYAQYVNRKATAQADQNVYVSRSAQQLGVRGNWTPKIESWASIGNGRYRAFGSSEPTANFNGWQLGSNYILSKRTNLYAIYGQTKTSSTSTGLAAAGSSYGVGVRHTF
jgi:predicted porin